MSGSKWRNPGRGLVHAFHASALRKSDPLALGEIDPAGERDLGTGLGRESSSMPKARSLRWPEEAISSTPEACGLPFHHCAKGAVSSGRPARVSLCRRYSK